MREERKEIASVASLSSHQIHKKQSFDATPRRSLCNPDSGAHQAPPMATCDSGLRSYLVAPSFAETNLTAHADSNKDAELSLIPLTTCVELITPVHQTVAALASPVSCSGNLSSLSAVVDQCSPRDRSLNSHPGSTADEREAFEPVLCLTPVPLVDILAGHSSSSLRGQHSDFSTSLTSPLSSPRAGYDTTDVNDGADEGTANVARETCDFPTRIMSSPGPVFGRGSMLSSSPPLEQTTTGAKRPAYDSSDEVRRYRYLASTSYPTRGRNGIPEGP